MADYYNYNNVSVKVNESGMLANSASFSFSTQLSRDDRINKIGADNHIAEGPIVGNMSLSYYVDAASGDPFYMPEVKPGQAIFPIDVGGLKINSGYLTSYSWSAGAHGILQVDASFDFYEDFKGSFTPTILEDKDWDWCKASDLTVSLAGIDVSSKIENISYDESHTIIPLYDISGVARNPSQPIPTEIRYGDKTKALSLTTYNIFEAIPYTGKNVTVEIGMRDEASKWKVKGILKSKNINISFGQKLTSSLQIEENGYGGQPVLRESSTGGTLNAGDNWNIYGYNLLDTSCIYFNNNITANEFTTHATSDNGNDSYIKVKIPRFARSGPIRVITPYGEAAHEQRAGGASIEPNINTSHRP